MEEGFVLDRKDDDRYSQPEWIEGQPTPSFWTGLKIKGLDRHPVTTFRCGGCGYLESFAAPA